ncbi:hypothetical protein MYX64_06035 [Nitrospinae bacterium AH_259_B05_G02_I21]|nr:hypothetical protein [Nitrospinae bacterium AH_259_B05_G02_I21]MDA2931790.1 hypothetical protein [Nitrospinae bacterium AH-259-F20]
MRWGKYLLLILAFTYLFPHGLSAEDLTKEQLRLKGLRSFKILAVVKGDEKTLLDKEGLKKEVYIYLKSRIPNILLVENNHDAYLYLYLQIKYLSTESNEELGFIGSLDLEVRDWSFQYRHFADILSVKKEERTKNMYLGAIWRQGGLYGGGNNNINILTEKFVRKTLREFVYDYYKANPGE